jgi:hypothetical protein
LNIEKNGNKLTFFLFKKLSITEISDTKKATF